ncbi:MAG: glycosyltransferase family 2 protein [Bacilli bacterium]
MKLVSIIVPMYNEEAVVNFFFEGINKILKDLEKNYRFEIITVNDGSKDKTLELLYGIQKQDNRVRVVNLTRNFGHESAVAAGLSVARGEAIIPMDADLQDPPQLIGPMLELFEKGYDVVNARRASRKEDTWIKRYTAHQFYKVIDKLAGKVKVPSNVGHFRLISRRVLLEILKLQEHNRVFRVQVPYIGYRTAEVAFVRPAREHGKTHYNFKSMFDLAFNAIISTTIKPVYWPLRFSIVFGALTSLSIVAQLVLYVINMINPTLLGMFDHGLWLILNVILVSFSIVIFFLGLIALYVGKTFIESQHRPFYIIESIKEDGEPK